MHDEREFQSQPGPIATLLNKSLWLHLGSHPLLQQTPLTVNPFLDLPKPPTLAHNYTSLPSTLPPSSLSVSGTATHPDLPAYVTSSSGFAAHPATIIQQNQALLDQLKKKQDEAKIAVEEWEEGIKKRDLAEKRRKAPGYLDSESKLLEPERAAAVISKSSPPAATMDKNLMDQSVESGNSEIAKEKHDKDVNDLGSAMDRAFG